ncbi:MAG: hypothetical protein NTV31_04280 [Bacteroidia bacterium]|nr:hypothetical protein [Bacteroidia bacterium]
MASLLPDYTYDIFISYRQKDNKHDGWVTEFVNNLKGELESTFKEDISIYFDENPHDRLQDTYNVGKSLEGKLKCLIFIPVLSQTYCDAKSYAWQYEFLAFNRLAEKEQFGRDVKLRNGNVASRILPIRIHDLDTEDVKLFEKETCSVMRAVDFVFRTSSGVSRPLRADEDHPNDNLNKTFYRDQINKTANAIKEIILGLTTEPVVPVKEKTQQREPLEEIKKEGKREDQEQPVNLTKMNLLRGVIILAILLVIVAVWVFPKVFNTGKNKVVKDPDGRISIAVNTFDNLTGDTILNSWQLGISELLIYNLGTSKELSVQNSQTIFEVYQSMRQTQDASVLSSLSRKAAMKLKAGAYITGNFQKTGNKIRIIAKLIDTNSDELLWTGKVDGNLNADYIDLADSLSLQVKNFLEIKVLEKNTNIDFRDAFTNSADAYRKFIEGMQSFMNSDYQVAIKSLQEAYNIDSTFTLTAFYIANANNIIAGASYNPLSAFQAFRWTQKAYEGKERLPGDYQQWVEMWRAYYITKNSNEVLNYCRLLEKSDIKSRYYWYDIGITYLSNFEMWEKAINMFEKIEAISSEWGDNWKFKEYYASYGYACHQLGKHEKEAKIYKTGLELFPEDRNLIWGQALCAIGTGDTSKTTQLTNKLIEIWTSLGNSASNIESSLGYLYEKANSLDNAEEHRRAALKLDPNNYWRMNNLAAFLINHGKDINEGMNLINTAFKINHRDSGFLYTLLWTKGNGYYKQGKYEEALDLLQQVKNIDIGINPRLDKDIQKIKDSISRQK